MGDLLNLMWYAVAGLFRSRAALQTEARDVVHDEYIRRVERVNGELSNVEFDNYPMVKDPAKEAKR